MFEARIGELVAMTGAELDDTIRSLELEQRRVTADLAAATAVVEGRMTFLDDGHRSMKAYLKAHINCSGPEANRRRRRAQVLNAFPHIGDALAAGRIGVEQVDVLAKAHKHRTAGPRLAEFVEKLTGHAEHRPFDDFNTIVTRFVMLSDPDGTEPAGDDDTATVTEVGGAVFVRASGGDPLKAAEMLAVFDRFKQAEFTKDCEARRNVRGDDAQSHPLPRSAQQRAFAAMYEIFITAASTPTDAQRPEPLVNIVIDQQTAADLLAAHGLTPPDTNPFTDGADGGDTPEPASPEPIDLIDRRSETSTGIVLDPHAALRAMIHGHVRRVVVDSAGVIIGFGRLRRLFTGKSRDAAQLLAVTCQKNGCDIPAEFCDVDHLDPWTSGHPTDQANAGPKCGVHNREKHDRHLTSRRAASGRIYQIRPDGTVTMPVGETEPEWADADREPPPEPRRPEPKPRSPEPEPRPVDTAEMKRRTCRRRALEAAGWTVHEYEASDLEKRKRPGPTRHT